MDDVGFSSEHWSLKSTAAQSFPGHRRDIKQHVLYSTTLPVPERKEKGVSVCMWGGIFFSFNNIKTNIEFHLPFTESSLDFSTEHILCL